MLLGKQRVSHQFFGENQKLVSHPMFVILIINNTLTHWEKL